MVLSLILLFALAIVWSNRIAAVKSKQRSTPISDAGVRELLAQGHIEEALDLYQRFTGVDLYSAKEAIQRMRQELRLEQVGAELKRRLRLGDKAGAIEAYQMATGANLAEALEVVERLQKRE
jgi:ribosomal protein L7/L12